jgi:pfkB family carbohydrate kinase.
MQGNSSYTGVVGTDKFGRFMVDSLSKKGVDISHLKVLPGNTAVTHVEIKMVIEYWVIMTKE